MADEVTGGRKLKRKVLGLLKADDFEKSLVELLEIPGRQVINPLFSFLLNDDEKIRWRAVTAMGAVIEALAHTNMEAARIIMRRLMWSLNDESGGIGWGAPEVMAEAMVRHEGLAREYLAVFCSYVDEEGNFLEYEILQRGLLWGLVRVARHDPEWLSEAKPHLPKYLTARDGVVRGLAAWLFGILGEVNKRHEIQRLLDDEAEFRIYFDGRLVDRRVKDMAGDALRLLDGLQSPASH
jgi:hypothetical protein